MKKRYFFLSFVRIHPPSPVVIFFPKSKLNREILKIAKKIASKSNLTIKIGKQAFYKQLEMPLKKAYSYTSEVMTANMMAMDAKEGISAFIEKRKPIWKNK